MSDVAPGPTILFVAAAMLLGLGPSHAGSAEPADLAALDVTRSRPLFAPTRRPPPKPAAVLPPVEAAPVELPPAPPPDLKISGIILGERSFAVAHRAAETKPITLEAGTVIDGWTVDSILPREIQLKQDQRTVTVGLARH